MLHDMCRLFHFLSAFLILTAPGFSSDLAREFDNPPDSVRPGVYWFFMDANLSREGMAADLEAMKQIGVRRAICLEVNLQVPKGSVDYMSENWLEHWKFACQQAQQRGIELTLCAGPGWCGAGGPWIKPERSMQHLRSAAVEIAGPRQYNDILPIPAPRTPFFGGGSLGPCKKQWSEFYKDVAVIAYPTPKIKYQIPDWEEKALFFRPPYSSVRGVKPYLKRSESEPEKEALIPFDKIIDVSKFMDSSGRLCWDVPAGNWTILRLGRRLTGQTTRPAPAAGLGLECDKFEKTGFDENFINFNLPYIGTGKFSGFHHDSWEMSSQNWSEHFRDLFIQKRGYDPLPWTPVMFGVPVDSVDKSERFLWDLRRTAAELVYENNVSYMKQRAAEKGLEFSTEAYDLNPAGDLYLFRSADVPMGEFWSKGYGLDTDFSVFEAVSSGHTCGRKIIGAESFTSMKDKWLQHPGAMKQQGDWALCAGINRIFFHRMISQPTNDLRPGFSLGPHGMHWDRTQTWFPLCKAYVDYLARCQALLQKGLPSADILYLDREEAPCVFVPPASAFLPGEFRDKREYNFDGCCPQTLIDRAEAKDGKIIFSDGARYSVLVLPQTQTMTLELAKKLNQLKSAGVVIIGANAAVSPSLVNYPQEDILVKQQTNLLLDDSQKETRISSVNQYIQQAKWIWFNADYDNAPEKAAAEFVKEFELPDFSLSDDKSLYGIIGVTADNLYQIYINEKYIGTGRDYHNLDLYRISDALRPGKNTIRLKVANEGSAPNPAGVIALGVVQLPDSTLVIPTDATWECVKTQNGAAQGKFAVALGEYNMRPWRLSLDGDTQTYPDYAQTAELLARLGVAPDFQSDGNIRWIHRIDGDTDIYFIGNRTEENIEANCSFRVTGKRAQLWNPLTGKRYAVDTARSEAQSTPSKSQTTIPIQFVPGQSWFVIFDNSVKENEENLPKTSWLFAKSEEKSLLEFNGAWQADFHQNASLGRFTAKGKPKSVTFSTLEDWSKHSDEMIKYYSGIAEYKYAPFDFAAFDSAALYLDLGSVFVMAQVELNGRDLGTLWRAPWRLEIPQGVLKPKNNALKITVANLWCNRLIGDASLPEEEKFTRSPNRMWEPGDNQLQPSGLLGPVKIIRRQRK